jgi:uracil phosphoribosyltransferase
MIYESKHPLVRHKLTLLRDTATEPKKFRELIREVAILLTYEATADLNLKEVEVTTPMGTARGYDLKEKIGLMPILRAGLGWSTVSGR